MEKGKLSILPKSLILLAYKNFGDKLKHVFRIVKATRAFFYWPPGPPDKDLNRIKQLLKSVWPEEVSDRARGGQIKQNDQPPCSGGDRARAEAHWADGVLTFVLPKSEPEKPKQIALKVS
jgi:hypothetical protein